MVFLNYFCGKICNLKRRNQIAFIEITFSTEKLISFAYINSAYNFHRAYIHFSIDKYCLLYLEEGRGLFPEEDCKFLSS